MHCLRAILLAVLGLAWTPTMSGLARAGATAPAPAVVCAVVSPLSGVAVQPDGKIVVSCAWAADSTRCAVDTASGIISLTVGGAFRFHPDGSPDGDFRLKASGVGLGSQVTHLTAAPDGRLLLSGQFRAVDGKPRPGWAMLLPDGQLDESVEPWRGQTNAPTPFAGYAQYPAALLSNGCFAVTALGVGDRYPYPTAYLLDPSGAYPPRPGIDSASPVWPRSKIMALAFFGFHPAACDANGQPAKWKREFVARLGRAPQAEEAMEELAALFEEMPIELCRYGLRLPDGGAILAVEATNGSRLVRFDSAWHPDPNFRNSFETHMYSHQKRVGYPRGWPAGPAPTPPGLYMFGAGHLGNLTLVRQPDGKLLLAGEVSKLNGEPFLGLARLLPDGSTDRGFRCAAIGDPKVSGPALEKQVMGVAVQKDGRIVIVGFFRQVNGIKCPYLARLNPDGSLDEAFQRHFTTHEGLDGWRPVHVHLLARDGSSAASSLAASTEPLGTNSVSVATAGEQTVLVTRLDVTDGIAWLEYKGNPSQAYVLQAREAFDASPWRTILTNRTDVTGAGRFCDEGAKDVPVRFYRVATTSP